MQLGGFGQDGKPDFNCNAFQCDQDDCTTGCVAVDDRDRVTIAVDADTSGNYGNVSPATVCPQHLTTRSTDADRCCEQHWALEGTGLRYGDQLAGSAEGAVIFGFEVDGLDCKTLTLTCTLRLALLVQQRVLL